MSSTLPVRVFWLFLLQVGQINLLPDSELNASPEDICTRGETQLMQWYSDTIFYALRRFGAGQSLLPGSTIPICLEFEFVKGKTNSSDFQRFMGIRFLPLNLIGYFADESVVDLNNRAKAVMKRVNVPIVPSYEITINQDWATESMDGRWVHSMLHAAARIKFGLYAKLP